MSNNTRFWVIAIPIFFALPGVFYWGVITNFTFDLFYPDWLSFSYNYYFLSIINGHLDVPLEIIGAEGVAYKDKVYMYYGILPAIARLFVYPLVNLEEVSVSRLCILGFNLVGVSSMQWVLLRQYKALKPESNRLILLITVSVALWFGSAHFSNVQNGSLYQEPYAASLSLIAIYLSIFTNDIIFHKKNFVFRLKTYAAIAGLTLFARPNIAVFLYLQTGLMIVFAVYQDILQRKVRRDDFKIVLKRFVSIGLLPITILLVAGCILLTINYLRFEDPFSLAKGGYGYYLLEGNSEKFCGFEKSGSFNYLRIIPHAIYYFLGDFESFKNLSASFGLGFVRVGVPESRLIVAWIIPVIAFIIMMSKFMNLASIKIFKNFIVFSFLIVSLLSTMVMLSYGTIEYRYSADLWMPFGLALLWNYGWLIGSERRLQVLFDGLRKSMVLAFIIFFCFSSAIYTMSHHELAYYAQMRRAGDYDINKNSFYPSPSTIELLQNPPDPKTFSPCETE